MNILLVTETYLPYITGVSISTDSIAHFMTSKGHKVTIVCPTPLVKGEKRHFKNLKVVYVPSLPFHWYNLNATGIFPLTLIKMKKLFKETKFDVVHIQEPGVVGLSALSLAKKHNIPTVGALHFIPEQIDRVMWGTVEPVLTPLINVYIKLVYEKYDQIMTPSHFFAGALEKINVDKPINVISNGVDTARFKPARLNLTLRKKLGFDKNDFVFFFLGRVDLDKNVETLVKAIPHTKSNIKLLIVGKGTEKKNLQALANRLKVGTRVIWIDYISDSEMVDYYHAVNAFSIMSPYEGQSIVTLQALAVGIPVIAANAGALPEICRDGENGYLVKTYDYKTLADKMNQIAKSETLQNKFGEASRKIGLQHDKSKVLHTLELIYKRISNK